MHHLTKLEDGTPVIVYLDDLIFPWPDATFPVTVERATAFNADNSVLRVHDHAACEGEGCPIHHPSDHHMRDWQMVVRGDKRCLVERQCAHGVGHPDPDSVTYLARQGERLIGVHGCDGCCLDGG